MIELFIPNNPIVLFFDLNGFWRENDVTVLKANFHYPVMTYKVQDSVSRRSRVGVSTSFYIDMIIMDVPRFTSCETYQHSTYFKA